MVGCLVMGGHEGKNGAGSADTNILEQKSASTYIWNLQGTNPMKAARWYPGALSMADGSVLTIGGSIDEAWTMNRLPEVWDWPTGRVEIPVHRSGRGAHVHPHAPRT